jgi:hypothetical protein
MTPPGEITVVNIDGRRFKAIPSRRNGLGGAEYLFNPSKDAFQYRVQIPGIILSMVTVDVTKRELQEFVKTGKPVLIRPQ